MASCMVKGVCVGGGGGDSAPTNYCCFVCSYQCHPKFLGFFIKIVIKLVSQRDLDIDGFMYGII